MPKRKLDDPIVEDPPIDPIPEPEPLPDPVPVAKGVVDLRTESKDGKQVIDNNYQIPNQPGYERFVSESNPTGKH